jgi:hypothetical protein
MTEIRTSTIADAGNGVFATKNYRQGDFICFYDCEQRNILSRDDFTYSIVHPYNKKMYIGFNKLKTAEGTGQFINDYAMFVLHEEDQDELGLYKVSSTKINANIQQYNHLSTAHSNVEIRINEDGTFCVHASKDISEDDELFFHYGIHYWISKIQLFTDEPFTRLYCMLKNKYIACTSNDFYVDGLLSPVEDFFTMLKIHPNGQIVHDLELQNMSNIEKLKKIICMLM